MTLPITVDAFIFILYFFCKKNHVKIYTDLNKVYEKDKIEVEKKIHVKSNDKKYFNIH